MNTIDLPAIKSRRDAMKNDLPYGIGADIDFLCKRIGELEAVCEFTLNEIRAYQGECEFEEGNPVKVLCDELKKVLGIAQLEREGAGE